MGAFGALCTAFLAEEVKAPRLGSKNLRTSRCLPLLTRQELVLVDFPATALGSVVGALLPSVRADHLQQPRTGLNLRSAADGGEQDAQLSIASCTRGKVPHLAELFLALRTDHLVSASKLAKKCALEGHPLR